MNNSSSDWFGGETNEICDDQCPLPIPEKFTRYEKVQLLRYYINELQNKDCLTADAAYSKALHVGRNEPETLKKIFCRYINTIYLALRASNVITASQQSAEQQSSQSNDDISATDDDDQSQNIESLLSKVVDEE